MDKRKDGKDKKTETPKEYEMDFELFSTIQDELCLKHNKEFVAVKDQQVNSHRDQLNLLEILNENNIDPRFTVIEFIKDN